RTARWSPKPEAIGHCGEKRHRKSDTEQPRSHTDEFSVHLFSLLHQSKIDRPNEEVQQRGRLRGPDASESRHAGPVCCNGWFGLSLVGRATPDYIAPPPSTTRRTTLPRTGLCSYACPASASGNTAPTTGRIAPPSINRAISTSCVRLGSTMKYAARMRSSVVRSPEAATVTSLPPGLSTLQDLSSVSPPTVSKTTSTC